MRRKPEMIVLHMLLRCAGVLVKTWLAMHTIEVVEGDETNDSPSPFMQESSETLSVSVIALSKSSRRDDTTRGMIERGVARHCDVA